MISETGLAALWLAAGLAALQLMLMLLALRNRVEVSRAARAVGVVQGALTLVAFAMLLLVFARTDNSVELVFREQQRRPTIDLQGCWHLGEPRRLDAALGHDPFGRMTSIATA